MGGHCSGGFGVSGEHQRDAGLLKGGDRWVRGGQERDTGREVTGGDLIEGEQKCGGCF